MFSSFCCQNENFDFNTELGATFSTSFECHGNATHVLDGRVYQKNLVLYEAGVLFRIACKQWRLTERFLFSDLGNAKVEVHQVRKQLVDLLSLCRYNLRVIPKGTPLFNDLKTKLVGNLNLLKNCVTSWNVLDERFLLKLTSVRDEPISEYFHMYLEVWWLLLSLFYLCEIQTDLLLETCQNLVSFSYALFKKCLPGDVLSSNSYPCPCLKQFWSMLFLFNDKVTPNRSLWQTLSGPLKDSDESFCLWLLNDIISPGTLPNDAYSLIDSKLKSLNSKLNPNLDNNQVLLNISKLVHSILARRGENVKVEPYQILWEIFNRHLDVLTEKKSPQTVKTAELVERIANNERLENSYDFFLFMVHDLLSRHPNQWPRMRGRIYCKLPPNRINELSDVGLHNISLLFFTLAKSLNLVELSDKFLTLLSNLTPERRLSQQVINIYTSLAVIHVVNGHSMTEVSRPLLKIMDDIADDRNLFYLVRCYVDGLDEILSSSQNFGLNQHLLIGNWTFRYMKVCQINDLCYFLDVLTCNVKRIRNSGTWLQWKGAMQEFVFPNLKTIATSSYAPVQAGELAALIDLTPSSDNLLTFTGDAIAPRVVCHFLTTILSDTPNYSLPKPHETAILHAWTRCCLLNCENTEQLTRNVLKIGALHGNFYPESICNDVKPICSFIKALGQMDSDDQRLKGMAAELCDRCFGKIDAWIMPYVKNPSSEAITMHLFTCTALLVFHCAPLLYHKSRANCLMNKLVSIFLLPTSVLMGTSPHPYILKSIQSTWHLYAQGIFKLNSCGNDPYLERTIRDLTVRYLPLLSFEDSPFLKAMGNNENLRKSILEKLCASFLAHNSKSTDDNIFKALKLVRLSMEKEPNLEKVCAIADVTLVGVLEVLMFSANKSSAIELVKFIKGKYTHERLTESFRCSIVKIAEKHLAFCANSFFQLTTVLGQVIPVELQAALPAIKKKVLEVERMRGVGFDNTLRQWLDRLEKQLR